MTRRLKRLQLAIDCMWHPAFRGFESSLRARFRQQRSDHFFAQLVRI